MKKKVEEKKEYIKQTLAEWMQEGKERFGEDFLQWKFKCPACGHISSIQDFKDAGCKDPNDAYQNCIGRVNGKGNSYLKKGSNKDYADGCDWAAYGLFGNLRKGRTVINDDGKEIQIFDFA